MNWLLLIIKTGLNFLLMLILVFFIYQALPSSPVDIFISKASQFTPSQPLNPKQKANLIRDWGNEGSAFEKLSRFLLRVARGDLGKSIYSARPVTSALADCIPTTFYLAFFSLGFSLAFGIVVGFWIAYRHRLSLFSKADWMNQFLLCLPPFSIGSLLFIYSPIDLPKGLIVFICVLAAFPVLAFQIRDRLQELHQTTFSQMARSKGLSWFQIYQKHFLVACFPTLFSFLPLWWSLFFGTTVMIEPLFGVRGLGTLTLESLRNQDVPVLLGISLLVGSVRIILGGFRDLLFFSKFRPFLGKGIL